MCKENIFSQVYDGPSGDVEIVYNNDTTIHLQAAEVNWTRCEGYSSAEVRECDEIFIT